jgi:adenylylsulfate kinase
MAASAKMNNSNIHPIFDLTVPREKREALLGQRAHVFWLTGLSGSGKSTLAINLEQHLSNLGFLARIIDGDNLRTGLCAGLGFEPAERMENIRRAAELARYLLDTGVVVICALVSPEHTMRQIASQIIGLRDFSLVYIHADLKTCMHRDPKGLYKKAAKGEIPHFTGISAPYDVPENPDLVLDTLTQSLDQNNAFFLSFALDKIKNGLPT